MKHEQLRLPLIFVRRVQCADASGVRFLDHHMRRKASGYWQMRITLVKDAKMKGKVTIIGLKTRDTEKARQRRDRLLSAFIEAGLYPQPLNP